MGTAPPVTLFPRSRSSARRHATFQARRAIEAGSSWHPQTRPLCYRTPASDSAIVRSRHRNDMRVRIARTHAIERSNVNAHSGRADRRFRSAQTAKPATDTSIAAYRGDRRACRRYGAGARLIVGLVEVIRFLAPAAI